MDLVMLQSYLARSFLSGVGCKIPGPRPIADDVEAVLLKESQTASRIVVHGAVTAARSTPEGALGGSSFLGVGDVTLVVFIAVRAIQGAAESTLTDFSRLSGESFPTVGSDRYLCHSDVTSAGQSPRICMDSRVRFMQVNPGSPDSPEHRKPARSVFPS